MSGFLQMRVFVAVVALTSLVSLIYINAFPPPSLRVTRDGVPYFTPPTVNPETGKPLEIDRLVRHFKGEKR